jgi:arginyl-tRNA synthetase
LSAAVERLAGALAGLAGAPVELERPADAAHGDYATNVALRLAPSRKVPPRELAQELADRVSAWPDVERAEVAGPGFLNLFLAPAWYAEALAEILERGAAYGGGFASPKEKVQVELVSANPTGPPTIGSARNGAYGDSVARLLEFAGHTVEREYYYNDAGAQMDRFRQSVEARRKGEPVPEDGYQGAYIDELAQVEGDPVPAMVERIEATLERFRVHIDVWTRESVLQARLDETLALMETYTSEGALWVRSSEYGDDKDRVLVRSPERGGTATYEASDAIYIRDKFERGYEHLIYVLGYDHQGVANWYRTLARIFGYDESKVEVLLYQLVHLKRGGETVKMGKRSGNVVFLADLLDEIGVDAARWYLVSRGPEQAIDIDVDLAGEHSSQNPVYYVQYAHARIAGILRNAEGAAETAQPPATGLAAEEKELVKRLSDFAGVVAEATERRGPHAIPTYLVRVADDFHRFYHHHKVLGTEEQAFRLGLCRATQTVIARGLDLIGVEAPERM